ncbi:MAG TPA: peptide-methionine (S)-S-oxide reductase MsrA [Pseudolabrys sp.]|jgi:peptide-methionine (S)-S-oxide reductase
MIPSHPFRSLLAAAAFAGALSLTPALAEVAVKVPAPAVDSQGGDGLQTVVLAGGCFWGIQAVYQHTDGVTKAVSGYSGGTKETASYDVVSSGRTGHAEAVEVTYDPKKVSYGKILQIFFSVAHDPTQLNRQGPDTGPQYRSEIFYSTPEQKKVTEAYVAQLNGAKVYKRPIVTKLSSLHAFYPAEDYHQDYAYLHPMQPYIYINDRPKVENLKRLFGDVYRDKPALVRAASN